MMCVISWLEHTSLELMSKVILMMLGLLLMPFISALCKQYGCHGIHVVMVITLT